MTLLHPRLPARHDPAVEYYLMDPKPISVLVHGLVRTAAGISWLGKFGMII
jgi:hypothetical protein